MSEKKKRDEIDYSDSTWLADIVDKTLPWKSTVPFSILSESISTIKSNYILPVELTSEFLGFTHLIAIYMSEGAFKRERLLYYHTDRIYNSLNNNDYACKLLCKMKIISISEKFDMEAEQALGLTFGLVNRLQSNKLYEVKTVTERKFYDLHVKFSRFEDRELVHIILLKPLSKK
ncbi:hypothetical protein [Pedobacter aquatilis]|uniref:hypothetical protein n=1 Tax=Pedobacter aquatilis TaxID=351343 RepID=UPI00292F4697|nr:hypothetical protein [Pedobacter aquatilis]